MPEKNSTDVTAGAKTIRLKMTTRGCVCMGVRAWACVWPILFFPFDCEEDFLEMSGAGPAVLVGPGTWALSMSELDHHPLAVHT